MKPNHLLIILWAGASVACQPSAHSETGEHHMSPNTMESASIQQTLEAAAHPWIIDRTESTINFVGNQQGEEFTGCFDRFDIAIDLDPNDPATGSIHVEIDMASAVGGSDDRNTALPDRDWFHVKAFPAARFVSTDIIREGDTAYLAKGELLLKGVSRKIELPFSLKIEDDIARAIGQTTLNRRDFNIGDGAFKSDEWVDFDVTVKIDITASR